MFAALPGSVGKHGAQARLRPSRLQFPRLSLALLSDPGGSLGIGVQHSLSRPSRQALSLLHQRLTLASHGLPTAGVGAPSSAGVQEGDACRAGRLQPCHAWRHVYVRRLAAWLKHSAVPVPSAGFVPWLFITSHVWSNATTSPHPGTPAFE